jgi:hypothetical protein
MDQKKTYKLDIFTVLEQVNRKNHNFYSELTDTERKGFIPLITMRWMSGTHNPLQIILLNEIVNPFMFTLFSHRDLLYKLLTVCAVKPQRYQWIKSNNKEHQHKHCVNVICKHYGYSIRQASEVFPLLSSETILDFAERQGIQKDELVKLKMELKNR